MVNGNNTLKRLLAVFFLAGAVRIAPLMLVGPQLEPDSRDYIRVATIIRETGSFSNIDAVSGKVEPTAYRMPLFTWLMAGLSGLSGGNGVWPVALLNVFLSSLTAAAGFLILSAFIPTGAALAAGFLAALNPNAVFNSLLVLNDTFFSFLSAAVVAAGLLAFKKRAGWSFFLWGAVLGLSVMTRPILKYYWVVPMLLAGLLPAAFGWKTRLGRAFLLLAGLALFLLPWAVRNQRKAGFFGLELNQGANALWSTIGLVSPSTPAQRLADPELARVRDMVAVHSHPLTAEADVRRELGLTLPQTSKAFTRIGAGAVLRNPFKASVIFARNFVNIVTSPNSVMELVRLLSGGEKGFFQPIGTALRQRDWGAILINLGTRALLCLVFFVCAPLGFVSVWKKAGADDRFALLLVASLVVYTLGLTSLVAGYDRYRLPLDPFLFGFAAAWLAEKMGPAWSARGGWWRLLR